MDNAKFLNSLSLTPFPILYFLLQLLKGDQQPVHMGLGLLTLNLSTLPLPSHQPCLVSTAVTEFKLECCQNPTIFPNPNPSGVQRQFWSNSNLILR